MKRRRMSVGASTRSRCDLNQSRAKEQLRRMKVSLLRCLARMNQAVQQQRPAQELSV
jgi:hypothetical protein